MNHPFQNLPKPQAIEEFDFESIFARKKQQLITLCPADIRPQIARTLELESEPLTIDLQQQAYSELLIRQRINEATRAGFLAFAQGSDLDHIGANRGLTRHTIQTADPHSNPPKPEIKENDEAFRYRIQAQPEKYAVAGPRQAYKAHAMDIEGVADANPISPQAGLVRIYIKSHRADGTVPQELIQKVQHHLSAEQRRPLCDSVEVQAAQAIPLTIEYHVEYEAHTDPQEEAKIQQQALDQMLAEHTHIQASLARSKIIGALDTPGTRRITLIQPNQDIECQAHQYLQPQAIIIQP